MTATLARVVTDVAIFLEFADESTVDPDASVAQLELLASRLQEMPETRRRDLAEALQALAATEPEHRDFVRTLPETLGLDV